MFLKSRNEDRADNYNGGGGMNASAKDTDLTYARVVRFASYQERCIRDIRGKLREWNVPEKEVPFLIRRLQQDGFLDERRFSLSFVRGKFRVNQWGKVRIRHELLARGIPDSLVNEAFQEITEEDYHAMISGLIRKKYREIKTGKSFNKREKIIKFVVGKGYEIDLVVKIMEEIKLMYDREGRD